MRLVIDMNLSPEWVTVLARAGHHATHWASIGAADATDHEILTWTQEPTPEHCGQMIIAALALYADMLATGALISVDENRARVRILPLRGR